MKKVSCIIPAYNEEQGIGHTLSVATPLIGSYFHEVIVVNDASRDNTGSIIAGFSQVQVITHTTNQGKSKSVAEAITAATGDYIFLLDADLLFLTAQNLIDLIMPIETGVADFSISFRKNSWPLWPFKRLDYLSGERVIARDWLLPTLTAMAKLPSYGLEVFINRILIKVQLRIAVVKWPNVEDNFNQHKNGWLKGGLIILKVWTNVLSVVSPIEMYAQNLKLQKLIVQ